MIKSHFLRRLVEYKELYGCYEHAVMSWDLVIILGFLLTLLALAIESFVRHYQGDISIGFHTALAFLVALYSFWAVEDFHFSRYVLRGPEMWLAYKYAVLYSPLKNALLYAMVCWILCRLIRKIDHPRQRETAL